MVILAKVLVTLYKLNEKKYKFHEKPFNLKTRKLNIIIAKMFKIIFILKCSISLHCLVCVKTFHNQSMSRQMCCI